MMNPAKMLQIKSAWDQITRNHPKLAPFLKAAQATGLREGTILEVNLKTPEGKELTANFKLKQSDIEAIERARR